MAQRYTVFLNEKVIRISEIINSTAPAPEILCVPFNGKEQLLKDFRRFSAEPYTQFLVYTGSQFREAVMDFESMFSFIEAAGGIVRNPEGNILFIHRNGRWDFPKGKLEAGETAEAGALREVQEETGLSELKLGKELPSTFHIYTDPQGKQILKKTRWYCMMYAKNGTPVPQTEEGIEEVRWASPDVANQLILDSFASLRDLFSFFQLTIAGNSPEIK